MSLYHELKRRNVFRVAIAYLALAWVVTEVAGTLFPAFGVPDWGVRFIVIVFALGFLPALIISWAYEITPEGLKREKDVVRDTSITNITAKRLDWITIGLIVLVGAFVLADRFWLSPRLIQQVVAPVEVATDTLPTSTPESIQPQVQPKSIAVLPFVDMSENQDQGWFADGLAEEILNTLVRTPDLMVSSRTSSFAYKDTQTPIVQIASDLNVAHVLEGSVRRAGDQIRVTAQLIRADDGFHVWSGHFDRRVENVISIQEDLAINIAKALKTTMDPIALEKMLQAGTRSVEAYEHYLNGLASRTRLAETSDSSAIMDALDHFGRARKADPGFAAAHFRSASLWLTQLRPNQLGHGVINVTPEQAYANYQGTMVAAIENAPDETRRMLYEAELAVNELRGAEAVQLARRVLEKLPNSLDATLVLSRAATYSRDTDAEILAIENSLRLGGITGIMNYISYARHFFPSEYHVANMLEQVKRFPNNSNIIYQAHRALLWAGEFEEAHKLYPRLADVTGSRRWFVDTRQLCSLGERGEVEQILYTVQRESSDKTLQWYILMLLGEHEEAAQVLKEYDSEEVPIMLGTYLTYQQFDPRPFPALMAVLEREGLDWPPPREIPFACPPKNEE
jgi:TolB-like protein